MNRFIKHTIEVTKFLPLIVVTSLTWPVAASAAGVRALQGTWEVEVTIRDCTSGSPIRTVPRVITFAGGGTLSEYTAAGTESMPVARAPGHGAWEYLGKSSFTYSVKFMRLTAWGGPDGNISEIRLLEVSESGDSFEAEGTSLITLGNGIQFPACATEVGTRLY